ncbi:DUF6626 family protein [Rhizobium sp. ZW T2_16]|uniref:DUF6626 family protein n=1 Tax=Rhizobium sp. ZW T2_16 TaxID=3378083 RepID=UPI00385563EC
MSVIEFLEQVCERMQRVGLVNTKAEFSERMLGKAPSYLTSMKTRERHASQDVIDYLGARLRADLTIDGTRIEILKAQLEQEELRQMHRLDLIAWMGTECCDEEIADPVAQKTIAVDNPAFFDRWVSILRPHRRDHAVRGAG